MRVGGAYRRLSFAGVSRFPVGRPSANSCGRRKLRSIDQADVTIDSGFGSGGTKWLVLVCRPRWMQGHLPLS
jgi:hypothetical protein